MRLLPSLSFSTLRAVCPIDGRYSQAAASLSPYFSESALMKYRIKVEAQWLLHLLQHQIISPIHSNSTQELSAQFTRMIDNFDVASASRIKEIELETNHDLKSVEYFMKENLTLHQEHVHYCCTSEDINNLAYSMMLQDSMQQIVSKQLEQVNLLLVQKSEQWAAHGMVARTHGQAATPTTLGKEYANFAYRISRQILHLKEIKIQGKMNGAVGNYNAHYFSDPTVNWREICRKFVCDKLRLQFNPYTTQIEPHDSMARVFGEIGLTNTILLGLCRDSWEYISKGYLSQKAKAREVGSSTMPHKVNPIDFENCEGNLGLANSLIDHFRNKLPISRQQRDLSDSTVLRNQGVALAYSIIGYRSLVKGLNKVESNEALMSQQLSVHFEVVTEAIQTELRRIGYPEPYELLKELSRGKSFNEESKDALIEQLRGKISEESLQKIKRLQPTNYLGQAEALAREVRSACFKSD